MPGAFFDGILRTALCVSCSVIRGKLSCSVYVKFLMSARSTSGGGGKNVALNISALAWWSNSNPSPFFRKGGVNGCLGPRLRAHLASFQNPPCVAVSSRTLKRYASRNVFLMSLPLWLRAWRYASQSLCSRVLWYFLRKRLAVIWASLHSCVNPGVDLVLGLAVGVEASTAFVIAVTKLDVRLSSSASEVSGSSCGKAVSSSFFKMAFVGALPLPSFWRFGVLHLGHNLRNDW